MEVIEEEKEGKGEGVPGVEDHRENTISSSSLSAQVHRLATAAAYPHCHFGQQQPLLLPPVPHSHSHSHPQYLSAETLLRLETLQKSLLFSSLPPPLAASFLARMPGHFSADRLTVGHHHLLSSAALPHFEQHPNHQHHHQHLFAPSSRVVHGSTGALAHSPVSPSPLPSPTTTTTTSPPTSSSSSAAAVFLC